MDEPVTVAACQTDVADLDVEANLETLARRVAALDDGVDVALFPEYALTGFVADDRVRTAAIRRDGAAVERLRDLAATHDLAVLAGFVEDAGGSHHNATAYVPPSGDVTVYRKRHLWGGEREVLAAGDERVVVDTPAGRTGLATCYDLNFVDDSAWHTGRRVDALFVTGAWPAMHADNWRLLCRARALDGVRYLVAAGRTGRREVTDVEPVTYAGRSLAVRPDGSVMAQLDRTERDLTVTLEPDVLAERRASIPVLDDGKRD